MTTSYFPKRGDRFKCVFSIETVSAEQIQSQLANTYTCLDSGFDGVTPWVKAIADGDKYECSLLSTLTSKWTFYAVAGSWADAPEVTRKLLVKLLGEQPQASSSEQSKQMNGGSLWQNIYIDWLSNEFAQHIARTARPDLGATSGIGFGQALVDMHSTKTGSVEFEKLEKAVLRQISDAIGVREELLRSNPLKSYPMKWNLFMLDETQQGEPEFPSLMKKRTPTFTEKMALNSTYGKLGRGYADTLDGRICEFLDGYKLQPGDRGYYIAVAAVKHFLKLQWIVAKAKSKEAETPTVKRDKMKYEDRKTDLRRDFEAAAQINWPDVDLSYNIESEKFCNHYTQKCWYVVQHMIRV